MEKNLAVTERRRDVIIESGDVLTEGKFMLSLTLLPAASFITFMGTGDLGFMLLMIPAIVPGPLGLIGLQWILSKKYTNKIKHHFGLEEKIRVPWSGIQFFEKRNGKLIKIDSPQDAVGEKVYRITSLNVKEISVEHNPMPLWDKALKDVKSVYSLKGKKALTKVA